MKERRQQDEIFSSAPAQENQRQSSYAARNRGISISKGEVFGFTDSDSWVHKDWISKAIHSLNENQHDYVGCAVENVATAPYTVLDKFDLITGFRNGSFLEKFHFVPTVGLFLKKSVINQIGPFDERFISSGDYEFGKRVFNKGFSQGYSEDSIVYHPTRNSFKEFFKRNIRIGLGRAQLRTYYPKQFGSVLLTMINHHQCYM